MARSITIDGFKEYADALKKASSELSIMSDLEASAAATNIEMESKTKAPLNLGKLRASINASGKDGVYQVTASADYAAFVEFGTKSKVQIPAGLEEYAAQFKGIKGQGNAKAYIYEWCRNKAIPEERWWGIYISIMTRGVKAQPFLFPSVDNEQPKFFERLKNLLKNL